MTYSMKALCVLPLGLACLTSHARESEGSRENSVLLNGQWEFFQGDGSEGAETAAGQQKAHWQEVTLPGPFMKWNQEVANQAKFFWARRSFRVTAAQASSLAVLRWNRIANGAIALINGQKVGENEPTGPFQVIVPQGILKAGGNQIVLKIRGAAAVRRSRSGNALIPAGFGVGMPEVTDDVWIDFADRAYMRWVLAIPDLAGSRVKIRVTPTGTRRLDNLKIVADVKPWPEGKILGTGEASASLVPDPDPVGGKHFLVQVPMPGFQPWTHEKCPLYVARVKLTCEGRTLDELTFRFGMREIGVKDRKHVVVIWDASRLSPEEKRQTKVLNGFLRGGGKIVVLSTGSWDWPELCEVKISHDPRFSRVFPYKDLKDSLLEGIDPRRLIRWNGYPGTVAFGAIEGEAMARAEKILWAREPKTTVMAAIPAASGVGRIVFSQLDLQGRVDRSKPKYDPVAERVLLKLLGSEGL